MLDSLVRVSRRVGWRTDRFATGPKLSRTVPALPTLAVGRALTKQFTPVVTSKDGRRVAEKRQHFLGPPTSSTNKLVYNTAGAEADGHLPSKGLWPHGEPVVAINPRKVHQSARRPTQRHGLYSSA
jgi:hypothetical protein